MGPLVAVLPQAVRALLAALQGGPTHRDHRQPRVTAALAAILNKALLSPHRNEGSGEGGSGSTPLLATEAPPQLKVSACHHHIVSL